MKCLVQIPHVLWTTAWNLGHQSQPRVLSSQPCFPHVLFIQKDVQRTCHFCPQCGCCALPIQGGVVSVTVGGPDAGCTGCPYLAWSEEASCREEHGGGRGDLTNKPDPPRWLGETGQPQVKTQKQEAAGASAPWVTLGVAPSEYTRDVWGVWEEEVPVPQVGRDQLAKLRGGRVLGRKRQSHLHLGKMRWEWRAWGWGGVVRLGRGKPGMQKPGPKSFAAVQGRKHEGLEEEV